MSEQVTEEVRDPAGVLKENQRLQAERKELEAEVNRLTAEIDSMRKQVEAMDDSKYKLLALEKEAMDALKEQGVKDAKRVLDLLDLEGVDFDDENKVVGLSEKVDGFKKSYPEFFDKKRRAAAASADIHADSPAKKELTGTQAQIERLFSR